MARMRRPATNTKSSVSLVGLTARRLGARMRANPADSARPNTRGAFAPGSVIGETIAANVAWVATRAAPTHARRNVAGCGVGLRVAILPDLFARARLRGGWAAMKAF